MRLPEWLTSKLWQWAIKKMNARDPDLSHHA